MFLFDFLHTRFAIMYPVYEVRKELCHIAKFFTDFGYSSNTTKYFNQKLFPFTYCKIN